MNSRLKGILIYVYICLLEIYSFCSILTITTMDYIFPEKTLENILLIMAVAIIGRFVVSKSNLRYIVLTIFLLALYKQIQQTNGYTFFFFLGFSTIGFIGIDYKKIIKVHATLITVVLSVVVFMAFSGVIENLVYIVAGDGLRSSAGICYPTDFASLLLYGIMFLWIAWDEISDMRMLINIAIVGIIAHFYTISDTSSIIAVLLIGLIVGRMIWIRIKKTEVKILLENILKWIAILIFPLCAVGIIFLTYAYSKGFAGMEKINEILSNRLILGWKAICEYGIHPFGVYFANIGNGGSVVVQTNYNFVDSTYILILVRYGWVLLLAVCAMWSVITKRVIAIKDYRLVIVMVAIAIHSISEHHFIEMYYNILIAMVFADYATKKQAQNVTSEMKPEKSLTKKELINIVVLVVLGVIVVLTVPYILSVSRTITDYWKDNNIFTINQYFWCALLFVATSVLCLIMVKKLLLSLVFRFKLKKQSFFAVGFLMVIISGQMFFYASELQKAKDYYEQQGWVKVDIINQMIENATGKVYVEDIPIIYREVYSGISFNLFNSNDAARYENATLVCRRGEEHTTLMDSGYRYAELTEKLVVYTKDEKIISTLTENGYDVKGYYYSTNYVDLGAEAKRNGLELNAKGWIILDGNWLYSGPYLALTGGEYTVSYSLYIEPKEYVEDYSVCFVQNTINYGADIVAEQEIWRSQFDSDGNLTVELPLNPGSGNRLIEFKLFPKTNDKLRVKEISYRRTPAEDVWRYFDEKMNVIEEKHMESKKSFE